LQPHRSKRFDLNQAVGPWHDPHPIAESRSL
jgi:hypothetical protein